MIGKVGDAKPFSMNPGRSLMNPLVSVVIPCRNGAVFVGEAIESALAQTYANVEVMVIDDGSTDNSLDIIRSFGKRIRWVSGPHGGACAARNRGVEQSRGELIQFLDVDDLLHPEKLSVMVPVALEQGSECLVICDWDRDTDGTGVRHRQFIQAPHGDPFLWVLKQQLTTLTPLHWKSVLQTVAGFDESLPCAQERDLHMRIACHGIRFFRVPQALVHVRRQPGSVSSDPIRVIRQHIGIVRRARTLLECLDRETDERLAALAGLLARDARVLLQAGLLEEASEYLSEALKLHPSGGWDSAYTPSHRWMAKLLGPMRFEELVRLKRTIARKSD